MYTCAPIHTCVLLYMHYEILPFDEKHRQGIIDLVLSIQQQEFNVPITLQDQPDLQNTASFYGQGASNFWVAVHEEKVVGTIALIDIGNHQAALRKMFVHHQHRGGQRGVAQQLFDGLVNWCRQKDVREVFLGTVDTMLAAHRFYSKNGFVEISTTSLPANFLLMRVDNKFFKLILT
jgi:N-acetylglutamate synthase-like GNAT family acetyltransferase